MSRMVTVRVKGYVNLSGMIDYEVTRLVRQGQRSNGEPGTLSSFYLCHSFQMVKVLHYLQRH